MQQGALKGEVVLEGKYQIAFSSSRDLLVGIEFVLEDELGGEGGLEGVKVLVKGYIRSPIIRKKDARITCRNHDWLTTGLR